MGPEHEHHVHTAHEEEGIPKVEKELTYFQRRLLAVENLLIEKGIFRRDEFRRAVEEIKDQVPAIAARVVARAWTDPAFKSRLLADAKKAVAEMEINTETINHLVALENRETIHHVVVCTLCSCYPRQIMGHPPEWYKSETYKRRMITEPRETLREFGLELNESVEIRVMDSTADVRYLILPRRPLNTEGLGEEELAELVTRDSMIGVGEALAPGGL